MKLNKLFLFLLTVLFVCTGQAQEKSADSLNKILNRLQNELGDKTMLPDLKAEMQELKAGVPGVNVDSIMVLTKKEIKEVFEGLSKEISVAKTKGDLKKLEGGYYELSKLGTKTGNYKQAYENYKLFTLYRDSLMKKEKEKNEMQAKMQFEFEKKQAIAKAEQDKKDAEQKRIKNLQFFIISMLMFLLVVILLIASIQWRNNKQKKKANTLLLQEKEKVEETLSELKATQSQLIQSEKMASLGELTAGIAHEIKNPLNFVNNFSEVNKELLDEMKTEIEKGNLEEVKLLIADVADNEEKIMFHGNRADAIVKGMLQHSRSSSGQKEPTDINALTDEYLRLAYHGLRAKDKSFNATMKTDFDESIGIMNIIPQDIGRVILNLITNAFYAVNEKAKQHPEGYEPVVTVKTSIVTQSGSSKKIVKISVKDNGNGISPKVLDKIFQPFFTTKPTGHGTGLGLSLSYDIIKAHGGEIVVDSKENEGSEFIIQLPVG